MPETDATLTALQIAIQTEIDGLAFYRRSAEQTEDRDARSMFERLAGDEAMHLELLRNTKATLEQTGRWGTYEGLKKDPVRSAPIFSRERVQQNLLAYTSELSALRFAYLIERDAVAFYTHAARETRDVNGQRMFGDLAEMEQGHLTLLEGEYNSLRSEFQHSMGFAPF